MYEDSNSRFIFKQQSVAHWKFQEFSSSKFGEFKWVIILFELPAELIELIDCIINTKSLYLKDDFIQKLPSSHSM